ncbi:response regulator transcription factor [Yersinia intermedia]|uniref:response regulator transcription factor n=1 Tax=Yersinia intermedia TaxID=631 RepID=UPI0005DECFCE|nr:response regulator transcription factor [Yersinia intermedia]CND48029.1 transcriptional regulator RcsB [Yersinia intermedia]
MNFNDQLRIIIVDDHPIFRIGLRAVIEQHPEFSIVAEAGSPEELLLKLEQFECDILITDFMMPVAQENDGLRFLSRIQRKHPELPILVVTMLNNMGLFSSILSSGINGVLNKGSLTKELFSAIKTVSEGHVFVGESIRHGLEQMGKFGRGGLEPQKRLSPKEIEVVRLLATGVTVVEIAKQLNRTKQTISAQKNSAMKKLGLSNDAALFLYLQENGLY